MVEGDEKATATMIEQTATATEFRAERIKGSVSAYFLDSVNFPSTNQISLRGWLVGVKRGALSIRSRADQSTALLEERPDVCRELHADPEYAWGFACTLTHSSSLRSDPLELELWVDRMPALRITIEPGASSLTPLLTPPQELIDAIGSGDFHSVGREFCDYFILLAGLKPHHHVLDIGCGVGRMALQLTRYLDSQAGYDGFDINPLVIAWCRENITAHFPNFRFVHTALFNSLYNRDSLREAESAPFPYEDESFDFVFATSVFTHLLPSDFAHYIRETARVLKPGGISFLTFFLLNQDTSDLLTAGKSNLTFDFELSDVARIHDEKIPEYAVGYSEEHVRDLHAQSGLQIIEPAFHGGWVHRPDYLTFQDVILARKTDWER